MGDTVKNEVPRVSEAVKILREEFSHDQNGTHRPIDLVHLAKQTLGDPGLETEVLIMFDQISRGYLGRLRESLTSEEVTHNLHSLKGAALGIGARTIVNTAVAAEGELRKSGDLCAETVADLAMAVEETSAYIAHLLND